MAAARPPTKRPSSWQVAASAIGSNAPVALLPALAACAVFAAACGACQSSAVCGSTGTGSITLQPARQAVASATARTGLIPRGLGSKGTSLANTERSGSSNMWIPSAPTQAGAGFALQQSASRQHARRWRGLHPSNSGRWLHHQPVGQVRAAAVLPGVSDWVKLRTRRSSIENRISMP